MKKFLLFLSCFLITWCSLQAATPSGKITSATYNASSSTINVSCTASNSNNVYMDVICMKTGPVVSKVKLSTYSSTTINLPITSRDGEYDLVLYVNGTPCYDKKVTVSKYGDIDNVTNISTSSVTVKYNMFHAETDNYPKNSYLKIGSAKYYIKNVKNGSYTWTGLNLTAGQTYTCEIYVDGKYFDSYKFTVPKPKIKYGDITNVTDISTSSVTVNYTMRNAETNNSYLKIGNDKYYNIKNVENGSTIWTGLNLTAGQTYTCEIYVDGERKDTYEFTVPEPPTEVWYSGLKLAKEGNSIKVDFTLRDTGVNVRIVLYDLKTYTTKNVDLGTWSEHTGTTYIGITPPNGPATYVATLIVNGVSVDGAQIYVK